MATDLLPLINIQTADTKRQSYGIMTAFIWTDIIMYRHSKPDASLQNPSTLSRNISTYGLMPYLDKHKKWGFIPFNNTAVNQVYVYPHSGWRKSQERAWKTPTLSYKVAWSSSYWCSRETLLYIHPRCKLDRHVNYTTANTNKLVKPQFCQLLKITNWMQVKIMTIKYFTISVKWHLEFQTLSNAYKKGLKTGTYKFLLYAFYAWNK
jgi:hypothetical protein